MPVNLRHGAASRFDLVLAARAFIWGWRTKTNVELHRTFINTSGGVAEFTVFFMRRLSTASLDV
jgi:hypothetical protein